MFVDKTFKFSLKYFTITKMLLRLYSKQNDNYCLFLKTYMCFRKKKITGLIYFAYCY